MLPLRSWVVGTRRRRGAAATCFVGLAFGVVVAALTLISREGGFRSDRIAASYVRVMREGKIWTLATSALVADDPVWIGLVSFAAIVVAAALLCPVRTFWTAALIGHVGSGVIVYAFIAVARAADGSLFSGSLATPDFGVSTIEGGLLGAMTFVLWGRAGGSTPIRLLVVAGVCVLAILGWRVDPDPSVLTYEHLVSFLLGVFVASVVRPARA